jgi:hypothetical protein
MELRHLVDLGRSLPNPRVGYCKAKQGFDSLDRSSYSYDFLRADLLPLPSTEIRVRSLARRLGDWAQRPVWCGLGNHCCRVDIRKLGSPYC